MDDNTLRLTAKTFHGLEDFLAEELKNINAQNIKVLNRAVQFSGDKATAYSANYNCRTALRILTELAFFKAHNEDYLYRKAKEIEWDKYFDTHQSFAINKTVNSDFFKHSHFAALRIKDAIADFFNEKYGKRPSVDAQTPDILINLHISDTKVNISLDTSGEPLYKRGYRKDAGQAPINEVLAAGLIKAAGDIDKKCFFDPMCGSGTIPIEFTMTKLNIPPAYHRQKFAFQNYKDYDESIFLKIKAEADSKIKSETEIQVFASDKNPTALKSANMNIKAAGLSEYITLLHDNFFAAEAPCSEGIIITNPPYNERLQIENTKDFYKQIGDSLKMNYSGWTAHVFSGFPSAAKTVGLRTKQRQKFYNGKIESRLLSYDMFKGKLKD
jgi:putative N6-adenine-specific DNA methylase